MKFTFYFKYKKLVYNILIFIVIFYLLINSKVLVVCINSSIDIFIYKLVPALFPYLLITELLINSSKIYDLSYGISLVLSKVFRIPKHTTSIAIVGFLLGYPNAAKCILKMYNKKTIDQKLATKLVSFTSNANPSYIIATVGIGIFKSIEIGIILALCHYISAIIISIIVPPSYNNNIIHQTNIISNSFSKISSPFELLSTSILGSLKTLSYIFAYTVIFSLIPSVIFNNLDVPTVLKAVIIGVFEISNGINNIQLLNLSLNSKIILTSFVLSFSSLMILVQIFSFVFKANVKFKDLLKYKMFQGGISCIIAYIILNYIYTPTTFVFANTNKFNVNNVIAPIYCYLLALIIVSLLSLIIFGKKRQVKPVA